MKSTIHDLGDRVTVRTGERQVVFNKKHWRVVAEMIAMLQEEVISLQQKLWKVQSEREQGVTDE